MTGVEEDKEKEEVEISIVMVAIEAFGEIEVVEGEAEMIATEACHKETAKKTIVKRRKKGKDRRNRLVLGWLTTKKTSQRLCDALNS